MQGSSGGRPSPIKGHDEQDVHTSWRKVYCWTQRAGATSATSATKRLTRRRERRELDRQARRGDW